MPGAGTAATSRDRSSPRGRLLDEQMVRGGDTGDRAQGHGAAEVVGAADGDVLRGQEAILHVVGTRMIFHWTFSPWLMPSRGIRNGEMDIKSLKNTV